MAPENRECQKLKKKNHRNPGTPNTVIPLDEVVNQNGVLKLAGKSEGDHVTLL